MNAEPVLYRDRRLFQISLAAGVVGALLLVLGAFVAPTELFFSYLTAFAAVVAVAVGALLFLMICHAMHAGWPIVVRRLVEAVTAAIPALAILALPLAPGLRTLYPWLRLETIEDLHERAIVAQKAPYLNLGGFLVRTVVYFAIWIVAAHLLRRWSEQRDARPEVEVSGRLTALSAGMLPPVGLAMSFASFDWLMSLTPAWYSTMYPVYYFGGGFLAAIALVTVLAWAADRRGLLPGFNASHSYALGRLLLAFTIFWAYAAFFQFFIVWAANKPEEAIFYVPRFHGSWKAMSIVVLIVHFALPFLVLLNYRIKRRPAQLAVVAGWLLAVHYIDVHWLVMPAHRPSSVFPFHWLDLAALLAVGGLSTAFAAHRLRGRPLVPVHDPRLPESLRYDSV